MKFYKFLRIFFIAILAINLVINIVQSISEQNVTSSFSFRNLLLLCFLSCYLFYKRWSLGLLIMLNITFWYYYFTASTYSAYSGHPIANFTVSVGELFSNNFIKKLVQFLPLMLNILVTLVDIPVRIIMVKKGNVPD